ncbi:DHH family phosphoesterase [Lederbergia galactosidilytica]|uniref:Oligoribonuclease n=1 Tax=Lederbergia galactosidilytica TaxID=217031 RepID=A0A177ZJR6_9BACI|nr:bifunctional oligoribonuclease/PAP phosphatase NrnA [Lederbergia galactosidilytica]KRG14531.1 oligoribonuclease [Virgibacillus soli]MBP1915395.1 phosphoesterase RecJ-like protein [Lederbergia galactosidilytica]OAK68206.1 oligoribonuclease [Lederbergia galactosidilytica]
MKQQILDMIKQYDTIIIHRHVRPDPDAYGSQGGLAEILKASFPEKNVLVTGKHEAELDYLFVPDSVTDEQYRGALVIVCDTANQERICDDRYSLGENLIKIDHHPNEDPYGDPCWVDTTASSTSELIYEFYLSGKEQGLKMTDKAARLIFSGIVGDTGRFQFPSTTKKTFQYASELIEYHFDRTELFNHMYELEPKMIKLQGYVYEHYEMNKDGAAIVKLNQSILKEFNVTASEASILVGSLGNIKGIKAWCFLIEEEKEIRVRLRSKKPVINTIARKYGGGGHPLAAGASVSSWEDAKLVQEDIEEVCR